MQEHLSSKDIQQFLDRDILADEKKEILNHIYACTACRQEFEEYKSLYQVLESEENFELSGDFTDNLLSQLPPNEAHREREKWSDFIFAFVGILFSFIAAVYYLGSKGIQNYLGTFQQLLQQMKILPLNMDSSFFNIIINPYLLAFVGILAVILFLDRVVLQKRMLHFM